MPRSDCSNAGFQQNGLPCPSRQFLDRRGRLARATVPGQEHRECAASARLTLNIHGSAQITDDAVHERKPEPGTRTSSRIPAGNAPLIMSKASATTDCACTGIRSSCASSCRSPLLKRIGLCLLGLLHCSAVWLLESDLAVSRTQQLLATPNAPRRGGCSIIETNDVMLQVDFWKDTIGGITYEHSKFKSDRLRARAQ